MKILFAMFAALVACSADGATYVAPVATAKVKGRVFSTTMAFRNDGERNVSCEAIYAGPRIGGSQTLRARFEIPAWRTLTEEDTLMEVGAIGTMRFVCSSEIVIATRIQTSSDDGATFDVGRVFQATTTANAVTTTTFEIGTSTDLLVMEVAGKAGGFGVLVKNVEGTMLVEARYDLPSFGQQIVNLSKILKHNSEVKVQIRLADGGKVVVAKPTNDAALLKIAQRMSPESRTRFNAHRAEQARVAAANNETAGPPITRQILVSPFKAAPFREPLTGLDFMRDRWYDPFTGRFLTPDRMGFADSPNPYIFTGGDPVNKSDPTGMYQADIHYGMTYFLAIKAGFCDDVARRIATGAEFPDQDPGRSPIAQFKIAANPRAPDTERNEAQDMLHQWHFPKPLRNSGVVVPASQEAQAIIAEALRTGNLWLFSQGIHPLQDSWSHRGEPSWQGVAGHPKARGGPLSTKTDQPWRWPMQARQASQATYNYLLAFRNMHPLSVGACGGKAASWSDIEGEVGAFIALKSKTDKRKWFAARGINMPEYLWDDVDEE